MRLISAVITWLMVLLGAGAVVAEEETQCQRANRETGTVVTIACTQHRSDEGDGGSTGGADSANVPKASGPAMIWIRWGLDTAEFGYVHGACRLWPAAEALPSDHVRVGAADCGEGGPAVSQEDVERMVQNLSASLIVPDPAIRLGSEPSVNEWNMSVVGLPIWLWTDAPRSTSSTNSEGGMTIQIDATLDRIVFDMGDGQRVACSRWTPYVQAFAGDPSPSCGHVYQRPSLPAGEYTITATAEWTAQWSAMGFSGSLPLRSSATRSLPVGELQAVVVRNR